MTEIFIIVETTLLRMEFEINSYLKNNWRLHGELKNPPNDDFYYQVMIKNECTHVCDKCTTAIECKHIFEPVINENYFESRARCRLCKYEPKPITPLLCKHSYLKSLINNALEPICDNCQFEPNKIGIHDFKLCKLLYVEYLCSYCDHNLPYGIFPEDLIETPERPKCKPSADPSLTTALDTILK